MNYIIDFFDKIISKFESKNKPATRSFFDFSSEEKKKIINEAADEANEEQNDLLKEYEKKFGKSNLTN